ncbi:MAG: tail fiber domain-containing protein [Acidobacteria bacterium]|nr:tail fiber domain-containing protein [Acidobacteriota bacterium]
MRPILLLSCAWLLAAGAQAGGPTFSGNVTSSGPNPDFILEDTDGHDWAIEGDEPVSSAFAVSYRDGTNNFNTHPFVIRYEAPENSLRISSSGRIGIGTATPTSDLEVFDQDGIGSAVIALVETLGEPHRWEISGNTSSFRVDNKTNGGNPLNISANTLNRIKITTSAIELTGSLIQLSSRESKTDFRQIEPRQVLAKVLDLPMAYWRYKTEEEDVRHLGPMAEDFHAAFGLGPDDQGIPLLDAGGVALAAIQGLKAEQDERMAEKGREIAVLEGELAELRELVSQLMAAEARPETQATYVGHVNW